MKFFLQQPLLIESQIIGMEDLSTLLHGKVL